MRLTIYFLIVILFLIISNSAIAQDKSVNIKYIENPEINLDGILDEPIWEQAELMGDFWEHFPEDKNIAKDNTEVRMVYNDDFLFISAKVYTIGNNYNMKSLMRDYEGGINDDISFLFDTFSDRNNAYAFSVSPYGVMKEGLLSRGGVDGERYLDTNWDVSWKAETKIYDNYYVVELQIPFFAFKYNNEVNSWRFNCFRVDPQSWVNSTWTKIPINQEIQNLGYMGNIVFDEPLEKSRNPFAVIPYALYNFEKNFDEGTQSSKPNFGGDAKIPIGSGSNLDLTINPDYSSTDINEGATNITRFELNLPEQRQFFLDNADLFGGFGTDGLASPFYSRRVGFGKDTLGNDVQVPILAGARFTGKVNNNLRVGLLDVQTAEDIENKIASNNNLVVAVEQKILNKSNISAFFINRQTTNAPDYVENKNTYNRVFGVDFNFYSDNNKWTSKTYLHKSITPEAGNKDLSIGGFLNYQSRNFLSESVWRYIGEDFESDLGFIQRPDQVVFNEKIGPKFYPKIANINWYGIFFKGTLEVQPSSNEVSDYNGGLSFIMWFNNKSIFSMEAQRRFTHLYQPFDPTREVGAEPLPVGGYDYSDFFIEYASDKSRLFSAASNLKTGSYYSGYKSTAVLLLRYRVQPYFNFYMKTTYDYITLPDPHPNNTSIVYVGPKFEFTFTKNLYWTTDVQFNSQDEKMGINSRVQWRYRPMSDLFIIYSDNYHTNEFQTQRRALFLKASFWLNI